MTAEGYAVELDGNIIVPTIGPSETAAQVNGLVTMFNMMIYESSTPEQIDHAWHANVMRNPDRKIAVVPVTIERKRAH